MLYDVIVSLTHLHKRIILLFLDGLLMVLAFVLAQALVPAPALDAAEMLWYLGAILPIGLGLMVHFGLHAVSLNAYELRSVIDSAVVAMAIGLGGALVSLLLPGQQAPLALFGVMGMIYLILSVMARVQARNFVEHIYRSHQPRKRVLIYGAGQTGQQLVAALRRDRAVQAVAFIDDNPTLQSLTVSGLQVYAPSKARELVERLKVDRVVLAMPSAGLPVRNRIARRLRDLGCEVRTVPSFADLVGKGGGGALRLAPIQLSEFLGRNRLEEELPGVSDAYQGRRILVTGAGGSIGSELCRQLMTCKPACVVLMDHSELSLYQIEKELRDLARGNIKVVPVLGSVLEAGLVRATLRRWKVDVVLHAAAYKHVPLVEGNVIEGVRNNVLGTKILADEARAAGIERFTLVSSDKAVRPTGAMGASKRLAELIVQDLATRATRTRFSMVRFGNVLGSSGSVIPLFEEQIARGGPVTLTDERVTRYFMTLSEAVRLVLLAGSFARGGDVFVLDMGEPVPIRRLARQMIEGAGFTVRDEDNPKGDIEIKIIGLRPGEKIEEELLLGSDMLTTPHPKILRAQESHLSELETASLMQSLRRAVEARDEEALALLFGKWIENAEAPEDEAATVS